MALGDYDDERGRDQMDREHWAEVDGSPVRDSDDDEGVKARSRRCHPARDWL